jgi:DNA-binding PadR family transcriptional regulator
VPVALRILQLTIYPSQIYRDVMSKPLPLTPAVLAILIALADGEKHGYAVMKETSVIAPGVKMGPGTLYGALDRMRDAGLVEESDTTDDVRRRYYRITPRGLEVLSVETQRMKSVVAVATRRLASRGARA